MHRRNLWLLLPCVLASWALFYVYRRSAEPDRRNWERSTGKPDNVCQAYEELRDVNFLDASIKANVCQGAEAYSMTKHGFPLCKLRQELPHILQDAVKQRSLKTFITSPLTGRNVPCFVYSSRDSISTLVQRDHIYEKENVKAMQHIVTKLSSRSSVTFVDIGANIGVFTLSMLDLGVPVVALDANIRNLMRIKLSAEAHNVSPNRLHLLWNFINRRASLMYLNFPADCNIGGATKFDRAVTDTIPVMSTTADSIVGAIGTRSIVLKVDIEGGEGEFFKSAKRLFDTFSVPVVHMEWLRRHMSEQERLFMISFFTHRNYSPRSAQDVRVSINIANPNHEGNDLVWIHNNFLNETFANWVI